MENSIIDEFKKIYKVNKIKKNQLNDKKNVFEDNIFENCGFSKFYFKGYMEDIYDISQKYYKECSNMIQIDEYIYKISLQPNLVDSNAKIDEIIKEYPNVKAVGFLLYRRDVYEVFSETGYPYFTSKKLAGYFLDDFDWFNEYSIFDDIRYRGIDLRTGMAFNVNHKFSYGIEWDKCNYIIKTQNELIKIEK